MGLIRSAFGVLLLAMGAFIFLGLITASTWLYMFGIQNDIAIAVVGLFCIGLGYACLKSTNSNAIVIGGKKKKNRRKK